MRIFRNIFILSLVMSSVGVNANAKLFDIQNFLIPNETVFKPEQDFLFKVKIL